MLNRKEEIDKSIDMSIELLELLKRENENSRTGGSSSESMKRTRILIGNILKEREGYW